MKHMYPYLHFNGECREAMELYKTVFGGDLQVMPFTMMPNCDDADKDRVLHSCLTSGPFILQASDQPKSHAASAGGSSFDVCVDCSSIAEEEQYFNALSEGGTATMPLQDTFWGARFGMLQDKFGVRWMFNCQIGHPTA